MPGEAALTKPVTIRELAENPPDDDAYLIDGELFHVEASTPAHSRIGANVTIALGNAVRGGPCATYDSRLKVHVARKKGYVMPDVTVVCGERVAHPEDPTITMNPTVVVEVLSPTSEDDDRGSKLVSYREIESVTDYLLVAQDKPLVEQHTRQGDGTWLVRLLTDKDQLVLTSIGARIPVAQLYEGAL